MPPKKTIAFGKIGSFGQLSIHPPATETLKQKSSNDGFGTFGKTDEFKAESTADVEQAMGFQGFGKSKTTNSAKSFDLETLVEQSKQVARERNVGKPIEPETEEADEDDQDVVGPMLPPPPPTEQQISSKKGVKKTTNHSSDEDDDSSSDSDDETNSTFIPASLEVTLNHGTKTVSALSVDHSGARLVTGSVDYDVRLWDFAGMSSSLQSFRTIRPCER